MLTGNEFIYVINKDSNILVLEHNSALSHVDAGCLILPNEKDLYLNPNEVALFIKAEDANEWYYLGGPGAISAYSSLSGNLPIFKDDSGYGFLDSGLAYTSISLVGHTHDDRYYTETEIDSLFTSTPPISHTHIEDDITDLDKYTQEEVDNLLTSKADISHTHSGVYEPAGTVATHESNYDHSDLHDAATVAGNGIAITGQQINLNIGTGADQVAAGDHNHDLDYADISHTHTIDDLSNVTISSALTGQLLVYRGSWQNEHQYGQVCFDIDGGGAEITTGSLNCFVRMPYDGVITEWVALADQVGSIQIDLWKDTYANFPPTDSDSIVASAPVTISSAFKGTDSVLSGWTTALSAGDILTLTVDSVTDIEKVSLVLKVRKT